MLAEQEWFGSLMLLQPAGEGGGIKTGALIDGGPARH